MRLPLEEGLPTSLFFAGASRVFFLPCPVVCRARFGRDDGRGAGRAAQGERIARAGGGLADAEEAHQGVELVRKSDRDGDRLDRHRVAGTEGLVVVTHGVSDGRRLTLVRTFAKSELIRAMSFVAIPGLIGPMLGPVAGGPICFIHTTAPVVSSSAYTVLLVVAAKKTPLLAGPSSRYSGETHMAPANVALIALRSRFLSPRGI